MMVMMMICAADELDEMKFVSLIRADAHVVDKLPREAI